MTAARRALATAPLRRLLPRAAPPARPLFVGPAAAARHPARPSAGELPTSCRRYSAGKPQTRRRRKSVGDPGGGNRAVSRVWTFDEVRRQVEANASGQPAKGEQKVVFIDVREPSELAATGKIPGAVPMPLMTMLDLIEQPGSVEVARSHGLESPPPPRDAHLVFYCRSGVRARDAVEIASDGGWPSLGEYPGGWLEWKERAGPVEKVPPK